jgi:polyhydroxyalkanoate synthesis regulator phasin
MFESLDKMLMAGLGAMSMSRERAEKIFDEYASRGQAERGGKSGFVKEMMDSADRTRQEFEKIVREQTRQVVETMNLATKDDIQRIESQLDELRGKLDSQGG